MNRRTPSLPSFNGIAETFQRWVDADIISGAVTLLNRQGEIVHCAAVGWQDRENAIPMRRDTIFRISSMTKPIVCLAAFMLMEEGKIGLEDEIGAWLPELAHPRVLLDPLGPLSASRLAAHPVTVRDLLMHTSGLAYPFTTSESSPLGKALARLFVGIHGKYGRPVTPDQWLAELSALPLIAEPGTQMHYGLSIDVLGLLLSRATHMPLQDLLAERIFEPLKMRDTGFVVAPSQQHRLAVGYAHDPVQDCRVVSDPLATSDLARPLVFPSGGAGLVSTVDDYLTFCRLLLGGGAADGMRKGVRLVSPETMARMTGNALKAGYVGPLGAGMGMTLSGGMGVVTDSVASDSSLPAGTLIMGGAYGPGAYVLPVEKTVALYMIQLEGGAAETVIRPSVPVLIMQAILQAVAAH